MTTRYHGHLALSGFDQHSQQLLERASVMLVGLGGVGCPVAQYLAAAGVGRLIVCDFDRVSESNLSRQILYRESDVGESKAEVAAAALSALNASITVEVFRQRVTSVNALATGTDCHLWIDTSDNWATRMAINAAAIEISKPWIMGAAIRREGQLAVFQPGTDDGGACYACLYGEAAQTMDNCAGAGVLSTVAGSVGLAAAQLALNVLTDGKPMTPTASMQLYDGQQLRWQCVAAPRRSSCNVCRR